MLKTSLFLITCAGLIVLGADSCATDTAIEPSPCYAPNYEVSFSNDIWPVVERTCASSTDCHASGAQQPNYVDFASLRAKVDDGTLITRLLEEKSMPPSYAPDSAKLEVADCGDKERELFRLWVEQGAPNN